MRDKVIVSVINNIQGDQRVDKVCKTLISDGWKVEVIGTTLRGKPKLDKPYETELISLKNQESFRLFVEFNWKLFWKLKAKDKTNAVLLANDVDSLLPNYLIHKIYKVPIVFDSHEIYSELPSLKGRKLTKIVWKSLERWLLPKMKNFYTVSEGYADWFEKTYKIRPQIIKNVPNKIENLTLKPFETQLPTLEPNQKIILYQGAINFSRGIDKMIEAMNYVENAQLWIIGNGPKKSEYEALTNHFNLHHKVKFIGQVSPNDLKQITPKADLGLSLEEDFGISYRYALPNKIFDYTHAGVPILGTNLPDIQRTIENYKIGKIVSNHEPRHIAEQIEIMLDEGKSPYTENLKMAAKDLNWENEEEKLKAIYAPLKLHK